MHGFSTKWLSTKIRRMAQLRASLRVFHELACTSCYHVMAYAATAAHNIIKNRLFVAIANAFYGSNAARHAATAIRHAMPIAACYAVPPMVSNSCRHQPVARRDVCCHVTPAAVAAIRHAHATAADRDARRLMRHQNAAGARVLPLIRHGAAGHRQDRVPRANACKKSVMSRHASRPHARAIRARSCAARPRRCCARIPATAALQPRAMPRCACLPPPTYTMLQRHAAGCRQHRQPRRRRAQQQRYARATIAVTAQRGAERCRVDGTPCAAARTSQQSSGNPPLFMPSPRTPRRVMSAGGVAALQSV